MPIFIALACILIAAWIIYLIRRASPKTIDRYFKLFQSSPSALIEIDKEWQIVGWNANAQKMFGWSESEVIGKSIIDLLVPMKDRGNVHAALTKSMKNGTSDSKNFNLTKDKKELYCEWNNSRIDHKYPGILCTARDITEQTSYVKTLTQLACHDSLTGVTNRTVMDDRLHHAIDRAQRAGSKIALYFIDLNDFKTVNDRYGHDAGDKLLIGVATALRTCMRNSDTISRFGGDEFVIIVEDIGGLDHIQSVLSAIEFAISEPIVIDNETSLKVNASIGISIYPDDATNSDALIKAADVAMYLQKKEKPKKPRAKSMHRKKGLPSLELPLYTNPIN